VHISRQRHTRKHRDTHTNVNTHTHTHYKHIPTRAVRAVPAPDHIAVGSGERMEGRKEGIGRKGKLGGRRGSRDK
jgi:hypothetical protein